ncbi:unnamed protein product [Miscanthus lutarioriparius]|uniref:Uncharacterized protein n=1 Tax=Miscanthus lutarioriparius TaxID=422564 RepID=A0A811MC53_9POAL|nr:unnamed protein product [Miscanthus lutarioriparius]
MARARANFAIKTWDEIELRMMMEEEEANDFCSDDNAIKEEELTGMVDCVREGLVRLVPEFTKAPRISTLSLHLSATASEIKAQLEGVTVACADKNLLVLFTGPDSLYHASSRHYLVYDDDTDTFVVAPQIDSE